MTMPAHRKTLCIGYLVLATIAFIGTWSQGFPYLQHVWGLVDFWRDTQVNPAARFVGVDAVMVSATISIWTLMEARKHRIRFPWLYVTAYSLIAVSVALPLFLVAREARLGPSERHPLGLVDRVLLTVLTVFLLALSAWIDWG